MAKSIFNPQEEIITHNSALQQRRLDISSLNVDAAQENCLTKPTRPSLRGFWAATHSHFAETRTFLDPDVIKLITTKMRDIMPRIGSANNSTNILLIAYELIGIRDMITDQLTVKRILWRGLHSGGGIKGALERLQAKKGEIVGEENG